ncbi:MAG TPA: adenylate/guanylate cyclase domain-containing protein [Gemmataceae bacterium]|nr:adenylate/guanylate cyclase domain-containing protein [Gemmataceae bacterium]
MIVVTVTNPQQNDQVQHESGPLEFGRGPQRGFARRLHLDDPCASRNHLRIEELSDGKIRIENLSTSKAVIVVNGPTIPTGGTLTLMPPLRLTVGQTKVLLARGESAPPVDPEALLTITAPARGPFRAPIDTLGDALTPEILAQWLERVIHLQRTAGGAPDFHNQVAHALVEMVGLDLGMVLRLVDGVWAIAAAYTPDEHRSMTYSQTLLKQVLKDKRTFYQNPGATADPSASLQGVEAVVASPVFGLQDEVTGALYGTRQFRGRGQVAVRPVQAQLVQLLAAAVGANQARTAALRTRFQFEQFFSPELVRELERDPALLEGRIQDVTILVSDLRGFTRMAEGLGAQTTCQLIRDMIERLSEWIVQHGGVIVDYAGDGILAMWNAPLPQPDHAERACHAALAMLGEIPGLNARWQEVVGNPLHLGIGLNTGTALVGNTGSSRKFKYGPHGHTVNLASRVQDATKRLGANILMSNSTLERVPGLFNTRPAGPVECAGVKEPVLLHELLSSVTRH